MEVLDQISQAIDEAIQAGVFWEAARLNRHTATTWEAFAEMRHERAANLLDDAMDELGVEYAGPCPNCDC